MKKLLILLLFPLTVLAQDNATVRRPWGQHTVSFTATPTFDAGIADNFKMTLTGNVTGSTLVGAEAGHQLTFEICQDGTGSRTFAWPAQMAGAIAITSTAGVCTTEIFEYDGATATNPTTATGGGGGSGTVSSGTAGHFTFYASSSTTVSSNANLDDGATAANTLTYAGVNGIAAAQYQSTGTGAMTLAGTEGGCSGGAVGKSVICLGDATSHSAESSLNGGSFFPIPQWNSTSPVVGGIVVAGVFPQHAASPRGTQGQPFLEGPGAGTPGFGQLDLSLATNVINRLVKANQAASTVYNDQVNTFTAAGTADLSASTVASAFRVPNGAGLTTAVNGAIGYDTTSNNFHSGVNGADHLVAVWAGSLPANNDCIKGTVVSSHIELASAGTGACGSGGTPRLDQILSATNAWTTTNADNPLSLQFAATTAGRTAVELTESAAGTSTGTPFLFNVHTLASSTLNPCQFTARGTANGVRCDAVTGTLSAVGAANINSTQINGVSVTGTPVVGQIPIATSSSASAWGDPIVSYNYVSLWTAQDITVTRTSSVVRVSTFSQYGTLLITFAGITGSPSACTVQIKSADSAGNLQNNGTAVSVSPANGSTSQTFLPAGTLATASQMQAVFACSVYPSAGTLTLDFAPSVTTYVPNTVAHNLTQLAGTSVDVNSGNKSAGTQRIVLATDQPNLTTPLNVALAANQSTNIAQIGGTAVVADPCAANAKVYFSSQFTANTQIIAGTSAKKVYFCSFIVVVGVATNVAVVEGTGSTCATGTATFPGLSGGTTAATGWPLGGSGGLTYGNGGAAVAGEATNADNVCVLVSAANQTNVSGSYVVQ